MRKTIVIVTAAILSSSLIGCASKTSDERLCADKNGELYPCPDTAVRPDKELPPGDVTLFNTNLHFQLLSDYTEQMAVELAQDLADIELDGNIAVSPFVYLDDSFRQTTRLGIELAEFFIHDLEQAGLAMREHRLSESLNLNNSGALSTKDFLESDIDDLDYVLIGTMTPNKVGLIVNARIIKVEDHEVLASSSKLFPRALFPE
jgi:TolB-like protein